MYKLTMSYTSELKTLAVLILTEKRVSKMETLDRISVNFLMGKIGEIKNASNPRILLDEDNLEAFERMTHREAEAIVYGVFKRS